MHGKVVGVRGEAALAGERQPFGDAASQLVEPVQAEAQLAEVRVAACRDLVEAVIQPGTQAVREHREPGVVVELGMGEARIVAAEGHEVLATRRGRQLPCAPQEGIPPVLVVVLS